MKLNFLFLIYFPLIGICQIPDYSTSQPEIIPEKLDRSTVKLDSYASNDNLAGTIGQTIYYKDKVCIIEEFIRGKSESQSKLSINCNNEKKTNLNSYDFNSIYFFNGIDYLKESMIGIKLFNIGSSQNLYDLLGKNVKVNSDYKLVVENIEYCKLKDGIFGLCLESKKGNVFEYVIDDTSENTHLKSLKSKSFHVGKDSVRSNINKYNTDGIFGRKVVYRNIDPIYKVVANAEKAGTIIVAFKVCINRAGIVSYAEVIDEDTNTRDRKVLKTALSAIQGYKYEPNFESPKEQCGYIKITLDINR